MTTYATTKELVKAIQAAKPRTAFMICIRNDAPIVDADGNPTDEWVRMGLSSYVDTTRAGAILAVRMMLTDRDEAHGLRIPYREDFESPIGRRPSCYFWIGA